MGQNSQSQGKSQISRRRFLGEAGLLSIGGVSAACAVSSRAKERDHGSQPTNLLLILTDQQRWDTLSCNGNQILHTPNLDSLAEEGVNFTQATCAAPLCGPSRAAMLSGRLAHAHGCYGNFKITRRGGLRAWVKTYDEVLHAAGHACSYHGKWHTGPEHRACYLDGLPEYLGEYREALGEDHPPPAAWTGAGYGRDRYTRLVYKKYSVDEMMRSARRRRIRMPHHPEAGESYLPASKSLTAWTAKEAIAFLRARPKDPFSLTCSILAPHAPLIASKPYSHRFDPAKMPMPQNVEDDLPAGRLARCVPAAVGLNASGLGTFMSLYYGLVAEVDHWVGELLRALRESGLEKNTLVVFTSDHGEMLGSHGLLSKMQFFEEAWRVPLIMRLPGRIPAGLRSEGAATGFDLLPTVLDLCGVRHESQGLAGRSLRTAFQDPANMPAYAFAELGGPGRPRHEHAVRSRDWKLVLPARSTARLYSLAEDPGEQHNLLSAANSSAGHVQQAQTMRDALRRQLGRCGDPAAEKLPTLGR